MWIPKAFFIFRNVLVCFRAVLNMWIPKGFSTNTMSPLRFRAVLNMWIPKDQNILAVCKNKKTSKRIAIAKSAMWQKIDKDMVLHQFDISEIFVFG